MGIVRVISFAGLVIVFLLSSASAVPVQMRGETSGLNEAVYTEPELMEALARTYGAIEWANRNEKSEIQNMGERNLDHIGGGNLLRRALDIAQQNRKIFTQGANGGVAREGAIRDSRIIRQSRRGLDSLSGATFGESKRFDPQRKPQMPNQMELYNEAVKRNMDEIDRTGFDSFSKRNFDEIDRAGWDSFVKRRFVDAYLASRQH